MDSEMHTISGLVSAWGPLLGSIVGWIVVITKQGAEIRRMNERTNELFESLRDHKEDNEKTHIAQEEHIRRLKAERDLSAEKSEREIHLRLTKVESDQAQIREILIHKIEGVADNVNAMKIDLNQLKAYIQAKDEFETKITTTKRRR